jgi:hypothetical protein
MSGFVYWTLVKSYDTSNKMDNQRIYLEPDTWYLLFYTIDS